MNGHWHLDKRVPISLIAAIIMQTGVFVWMLSEMRTEIAHNEERIISLEAKASVRAELITNNTMSIAVINETLRNMEASLARIEDAIEKL